ncbi:MAG: 3'(2'),5'-bisphosphate nucleotidase CysQ [Allomuricauda sp.]
MKLSPLLEIAIDGAIAAGKKIMEIYSFSEQKTFKKEDDSPLTLADVESNKVLMSYLEPTEIPIISEENQAIEFEIRNKWGVFWLVDPLDGTKEFLNRNGEFTVNIALIKNNEPILGIIYAPVLNALYFASVEEKIAFKAVVNEDHTFLQRHDLMDLTLTKSRKKRNNVRVVCSRSHMNDLTERFIDKLRMEMEDVEIVSAGSSLKFCLVAEGRAEFYPRAAPTMEWDTAAGHAICKAAGYMVTQWECDNELMYNKENLLNPYFLVH